MIAFLTLWDHQIKMESNLYLVLFDFYLQIHDYLDLYNLAVLLVLKISKTIISYLLQSDENRMPSYPERQASINNV